jgi:hypothetical protein
MVCFSIEIMHQLSFERYIFEMITVNYRHIIYICNKEIGQWNL